jgi:penicillin-binding protein 1A
MVVMEPDGAVRAIVGGRDYGASQFNRATDALRQPGSSFKPYVYLTALMTGKFKPTTVVVDSPVCIGNYCVHNYSGGYAGSLPLSMALAKSLNTIAIKLSIAIGNGDSRLGRKRIMETCRKLGITTPLEDTPSLPVGQSGVILLEHSAAYAAFVNGGKRTPPHATIEIRDSQGAVVYRHDRDAPPQQQVLPPDKVVELASMMKRVVDEGTARRAQLEGIDVIGKTGTTNGYKDAWFCGYSGTMGGCVWYGNDDNDPMNNMTGGTLPAGTWHDVMAYAHQGVPLKPIVGFKSAPSTATVAAAAENAPTQNAPLRPGTLSKGALQALESIQKKIHMIETPAPDGKSDAMRPGAVDRRGALEDGTAAIAAAPRP